MKYLIVFFIAMLSPFLRVNKESRIYDKGIDAYTETGHDQFKSITPIDSSVKLLINMSDEYLDGLLDGLKRKFFGESEVTLNLYKDGKYVSNTLFSRSNLTRDAFVFSYDYSTITYNEISISVKGTISAKGTYKGKNKERTINGEITGTFSEEISLKNSESTNFKVVVYPGKRVTLRIVGECKISNGIKKNYFFGIRTSQGAWEVIDVISACCELIEEDA
ncbi:MAG: hypothetical protein IJS58_07950 [Bacilli bacterium]|nr:hypothetical protein [Bacilli bacterium]